MTALSGGSADKLGSRYELWWTVSELVRMLHEQADSIRIEDPGVIKAKFVEMGSFSIFNNSSLGRV